MELGHSIVCPLSLNMKVDFLAMSSVCRRDP